MRVHHLDCLTMCPYGGSLLGGTGGIGQRVKLVAHCLLVERKKGLLLVDTGAALQDADDPNARFGRAFILSAGARIKKKRCAVEQIKALGLDPLDVKDIVLTHLDLDHAAGLVDFPNATVHVTSAELAAAKARATLIERMRYLPAMWAHNPKWQTHDANGGERWKGFEAVRPIDSESDVLMIPLKGHTRGHAAIAVKSAIPNGREWLLHAGDSYFFHDEVHANPPRCPSGLAFYQSFLAPDDDARKQNQDRLRRLAADKSAGVHVFCAHSATELDDLVRIASQLVDDRPIPPDASASRA